MNSNSLYNDFFFPRDAMHSTVLPQYSVCLSVCDALQVPVPCSHRLEFFEYNFTTELALGLRWLTPTWAIWCNGNTPKLP